MECFAFATGRIDILRKESREAAKFFASQQGFFAVNIPDEWHTLWVYLTLNDAKKARNLAEARGAKCGNHIMRCDASDDMQTLLVIAPADM